MATAFAADFDMAGGKDRAPAAPVRAAPALSREPADAEPSRYGERRGPSLPALAAIVAAHVLLLWALVSFDVIEIRKASPVRTMVTMELEPPPPPEVDIKPVAKVKAVAPPLIAPPPIVQTPQPAPQLVVDHVPPPLVPVVVATPAPVAETPVAAPLVPPTPAANKGNDAPKYPIEARRRRWEGVVRLTVLVSTEGKVKEIRVSRSSGHEELDRAALSAVSRWKFEPAMRGGAPVESWGNLSIPFQIRA